MPTPLTRAPADPLAVALNFRLPGACLEAVPHGHGHINDTFAITIDAGSTRPRYVLQRINQNVFRNVPALMENVERVTAHVSRGAPPNRALVLVPSLSGASYVQDAAGEYWRCYHFIEGARTHDVVNAPERAFEAARAFGNFQRLLQDLPGPRLHETIPQFHDTRHRFGQFREALKADRCERASGVKADIEFVLAREPLADVLLGLHRDGAIPERITHNDTKLNNVMLDDATGTAVCVIDLDTVMPGLALYDFGDLVRTGTSAAAEDETDVSKVSLRMPMFEALVRGYAASAGAFLNAAERAHLAFAGKLITFEIGLRFFTDYLDGDRYFKTRHPRHNLDRARNQFALVQSIEQQESAMQRLVDFILKTP